MSCEQVDIQPSLEPKKPLRHKPLKERLIRRVVPLTAGLALLTLLISNYDPPINAASAYDPDLDIIPPIPTETAKGDDISVQISDETYRECLRVNTGKYDRFFGFAKAAKTLPDCQLYFPASRLVDTIMKYYEQVQPLQIEIPVNLKPYIRIRYPIDEMAFYRQKEGTCFVTTIANAVSSIWLRHGLPAIHPAVVSDLIQRNEDTGKRDVNYYEDLNKVYFDAGILGKLGVGVVPLDVLSLIGQDTEVMKQDSLKIRFEAVEQMSLEPEKYQVLAKKIFDEYMKALDDGLIPTFSIHVTQTGRHIFTVLGGRYNPQSNNYEFIIYDTTDNSFSRLLKGYIQQTDVEGVNVLPLSPHILTIISSAVGHSEIAFADNVGDLSRSDFPYLPIMPEDKKFLNTPTPYIYPTRDPNVTPIPRRSINNK